MAENTLTEEEINAIGRDYALHANKYEQENTMEIKCEQVGSLSGGKWDKMHEQSRRYYSADGLCPTIPTSCGGNHEPKIAEVVGGIGEKKSNGCTQYFQQDRIYEGDIALAHPANLPGGSYWYTEPMALDEQNGYIRGDGTVGTLTTDGSSPKHNNRVVEPIKVREATKQGYAEAFEGDSINLEQPNSTTRRGRVGKQVAQTLTTQPEQAVVEPSVKIRKLTERECFRLMGVKDEDFDKVKKNQSTSSLYHLAGDSIVVDVLMAIFNEIL